jgi:hypothetical protein
MRQRHPQPGRRTSTAGPSFGCSAWSGGGGRQVQRSLGHVPSDGRAVRHTSSAPTGPRTPPARCVQRQLRQRVLRGNVGIGRTACRDIPSCDGDFDGEWALARRSHLSDDALVVMRCDALRPHTVLGQSTGYAPRAARRGPMGFGTHRVKATCTSAGWRLGTGGLGVPELVHCPGPTRTRQTAKVPALSGPMRSRKLPQ